MQRPSINKSLINIYIYLRGCNIFEVLGLLMAYLTYLCASPSVEQFHNDTAIAYSFSRM